MNSSSILFPGWAVDPGKYLPLYGSEGEIIDFGFSDSSNTARFSFEEYEFPKTSEDVVVVGHSLGSLFALGCALRQPVKALILLCPFARFTEDEEYPGQGVRSLQSMIRTVGRRTEATLGGFFQQVYAPDVAPELGDDAEYNGGRLKDGLQILADADLRSRLKEIDVPICIICGEEDQVVRVETSVWLADNLPNAQLHLVKDAGHALPFVNQVAVAELMKEFVSSL